MSDPTNQNELIEKMARRLACSRCGWRYRPNDFTILDEREGASVMQVTCRHCRKQSVVVALVHRRRVKPVYSELDPDEWERFKPYPAVGADDVIAMHRVMSAYDGDFTDVLEDPLPPEDDEY